MALCSTLFYINSLIFVSSRIKFTGVFDFFENNQDGASIYINSNKDQLLQQNSQNLHMKENKNSQNPIQKLLYIFNQDILTIQSSTSFFKVNFSTPILQCFQFLQRYEKYFLKSELLSIPIHAMQFDQVYSEIKDDIDHQFDYFLNKSMQCIEEMLINTVYYKCQKWHYYAKTIQGFKMHLLGKDIDCYDFRIQQFDDSYNRVIEIIKETSIGALNRSQQTKIQMNNLKEQVKNYQKNIEEAEKKILNKDMFVVNPYKAQNFKNIAIDASQLFKSYYDHLKFKSEPIYSGFKLRHDEIHKKVLDFYESILEHSQDLQKVSQQLVRHYNDFRMEGGGQNNIAKKLYHSDAKQVTSLDELEPFWSKRQVKNRCLDNRLDKVSIDENVVVFSQETKELRLNTLIDTYRRQAHSNIYCLNSLQDQKIPMSSEYLDFWDYTYNRDKLRKLHIYHENIGKGVKNFKQTIKKNMKQTKDKMKMKAASNNKRKKQIIYNSDHKKRVSLCLYSDLLERRTKYEQKLWAIDEKKDKNKSRTSYQNCTQKAEKSYFNSNRQEQERIDQRLAKQQLIDQFYVANVKYEQQVNREISLKIKGGKLADRNYQTFCKLVDIQNTQTSINNQTITRYNINLNRKIQKNQPIKLQQFLCYYLRQRLHRQNQHVKDKKSIFLFFYSKSVQKFCSKTSIKFLLKKINQGFKRYILWGSEVIQFEEYINPDKTRQAKFTIYPFSKLIYSQRIFFELKRYAPFPIVDTIEAQSQQTESNIYGAIMRKFQIVSRLVLKDHLACPDKQSSQIKGRQNFEKMLAYFQKDISLNK